MNVTEEELEKIVNSKKCKSVKIDGKNYYISKEIKDELKKKKHSEAHKGGFAFLAAIPAIIGALAGTAGIASIVSNSRDAIKKQKEIELLDKAKTAQLASGQTETQTKTERKSLYLNKWQGEGIYLNPWQGNAIHKYLKNINKDPNLKDVTKTLKKN